MILVMYNPITDLMALYDVHDGGALYTDFDDFTLHGVPLDFLIENAWEVIGEL